MFVNEKSLIQQKSYDEMFKVQFDRLYDGKLQKMGLVWFIEEYDGYDPIYQHGGGTLYHRSIVKICPEQNLGVVILTNSYYGNSVCSLSSKILKKAIDLENGNIEKRKTKTKEQFTRKDISQLDLNKWDGAYATPGAVYEVKTKKNRLSTEVQGTKIDMIYVGSNEFVPVAKLLGFIPIKMKSLRFVFENKENETLIYQKDIERNRLSILGQLFDKSKITSKWEDRIGKYKVVNNREGDFNFFDEIEITKENDILILKAKVKMDVEQEIAMGLGILSDELAFVLGKGRQGGYSVAVEYNEEGDELLRFTGFLLKKEYNNNKSNY